MWFRLAMLLGMSVRECQHKVSAKEFAEWLAFFQLEPMPDSWLQHGVLCQLIANALGSKTAKPQDFMPRVKKRQTVDEIFGIVSSFQMQREAKRKK